MTWVLLRGLARESGHWGSFPGHFALALGEPVVTLDVPGNGTRCAERTPLRIDAIVEACRADAFGRGLQPPFDVLGLSMGAMVAIEWAHRFPVEVRRCVLINTSVQPYARFFHRLRPASYRALLGVVLGGDLHVRERVVLGLTSADAAARADVVGHWVALAQARPVTRGNVLRQMVAAARYRGPPGPPARDMLVLASTNDRLVDVRCSRAIAAAWAIPLVEHPSAGHDLPLDDPQWVIEKIRDWAVHPLVTGQARAVSSVVPAARGE